MEDQHWHSEQQFLERIAQEVPAYKSCKTDSEMRARNTPLDWSHIRQMHALRRRAAHEGRMEKGCPGLTDSERYTESLRDMWDCCLEYVELYRNGNPYHLPDEHPEAWLLREQYEQSKEDERGTLRRRIRMELLEEKDALYQQMRRECEQEKQLLRRQMRQELDGELEQARSEWRSRQQKRGAERAAEQSIGQIHENMMADLKSHLYWMRRERETKQSTEETLKGHSRAYRDTAHGRGLVTAHSTLPDGAHVMLAQEKARHARINLNGAIERLESSGQVARLDIAARIEIDGAPRLHMTW